MPDRIVVIGLTDPLPKQAQRALESADLVVGGHRHLDALAVPAPRRCTIEADVMAVLDEVAGVAGVVAVLTSGDPGFFGMVRPLAARFGASTLEVHPAPSSVSLAFARLGLAWDDAGVVSAHGRPLADAVAAAVRLPKVAILASPENPPELIAAALLEAGARHQHVAVCARLDLPDELVLRATLHDVARGTFDPLSVLVCHSGSGLAAGKSLAWGLEDDAFDHRAGMITKAEVRAVALGKLDLPGSGVLWDVGAGSGSVGIECARIAPGLRVVAVERDAEACAQIDANQRAHAVHLEVVQGEAPAVLRGLPEPDRVFVGGGGLDVLDEAVARLRPGGTIVATYAAVDRAVAAAGRLGELIQLGVARGERLSDGGLRLAAANPVFVAWGSPR